MIWAPIQLADNYPSLRGQIDDVTDRAWVALAWTLLDFSLSPVDTGSANELAEFEVLRLKRHSELLRTYVAASGLNTSEWTTATLLEELKQSLNDLSHELLVPVDTDVGGPDGWPFEIKALAIFEVVVAHLRNFGPRHSDIAALLNLADVCLDVMTELESSRSSDSLAKFG